MQVNPDLSTQPSSKVDMQLTRMPTKKMVKTNNVKMLQKVRLIALGMVTRGLADSPAPMAHNSVPWKAKPA